MSISLMNAAWKAQMPPGRKFVLISLCDNAGDGGECYPSISTIAGRCSMGERTVQGHVHDLEKSGILKRQERAGRSTIYTIDPRRFCTPLAEEPPQILHPHPRRICTPADFAPPQILHPTPADSAPPPPQISHPTPADFAPITINEPSTEPKEKQKKRTHASASFVLPDWLNPVHWAAWHSCAKRRNASPEQMQMAIGKLSAWREKGEDFAGALENAAVGGWQGLFLPEKKGGMNNAKNSGRHSGFDRIDYTTGIEQDGTFA